MLRDHRSGLRRRRQAKVEEAAKSKKPEKVKAEKAGQPPKRSEVEAKAWQQQRG
jgi:hypothetical protein